MNALLVAIRIPELDPVLDAEIASVGSHPNSPMFGPLLHRRRLAQERLKRTGVVGRISLSDWQPPS